MAKMEFPTVNKFLFCCGLRAGGFVLGWISAVFSGLAVIILGIRMIVSMIGLGDIVIYMFFPCLVLFVSINLINGTSNRNHVQIRPYLIMMIVGLVLEVIFICRYRGPVRSSIVLSIIVGIIEIYLFICIYSLYDKTKKARVNAGTVNNQPPANTSSTISHELQQTMVE